ncbi:hypothetical protein G3I77_11995 [Streptomyces sp. D2-8]|nr:hypothetical protein [Streptomyces sp. D2-8]MCK8433734.1 hypothetical protein [Streptomyces sp. D2-8]
MTGLQKTGRKNYGSNDNPLYGYQSFVSMISTATSSTTTSSCIRWARIS